MYPNSAQPAQPRKTNPWLWGCLGCGGAAALVLVLGVGCAALVSTGEPPAQKDTPAADAPKDDTKKDDGKEKEKTAKIGDTVESGAFAFTVTDVETGVEKVTDSSGYLTETPDGQYVIVSVTVENIGDQAGFFDSTSQKLLDADGKQYSTDTAAEITGGAESFLNEINPGNSVDGELIFDVPADMKPAKIELKDFLSLDEGAVVDLT